MAQRRTLILDSGALILGERDRRIDALLKKWASEGASIIVPAIALAEATRGGPRDATINRIVHAVERVASIDEPIARNAGRKLARRKNAGTVDAVIMAAAEHHQATDIATTDPIDMKALSESAINIISL